MSYGSEKYAKAKCGPGPGFKRVEDGGGFTFIPIARPLHQYLKYSSRSRQHHAIAEYYRGKREGGK